MYLTEANQNKPPALSNDATPVGGAEMTPVPTEAGQVRPLRGGPIPPNFPTTLDFSLNLSRGPRRAESMGARARSIPRVPVLDDHSEGVAGDRGRPYDRGGHQSR